MKHLIHHVKKHSKRVVRHLNTHKHKYLFGTFGTFAIFKTFLLLVGFFGTLHIANIFAADIEVNSGNIVTEYGCATDANSCDLSNKGITSIAPDTFVNHTNLQQLNLNYNQLTTIDLSGLTGLTNLDLNKNQLASIDLSGLTELTNLGLSNNQLSSIDLSGLTGLTYLDLDNNQLTSIDLSGLTGLTNLGLGSNQLSSIDLSGLTELTNLWLGSNQLSSIDLSGLTGLQGLGLGSNQLSSIDLSGLTELTNLYLGDNQISVLPQGIFDNLSNLNYLYLDNNQISVLPEGIFDNLTGLRNLRLNNNQISVLPEGIFDNLSNLNYLYLDNNQISVLPEGIFDNLSNLQILYLYGNQISVLPEGIFDNLSGLRNLDLVGNQISVLPEGIFDNLSGLRNLDLGGNQINSIESGVFAGLTSLQRLYLNNNQLSSIDLSNLPHLVELNLMDNQLASIDLSGLTELTNLGLGSNQLSSIDLSGLTSLQRLYLNNNQLTSVPEILMDNQGLQTGQLNLYYNRISTGGLSPALISFIDARHTTSEGDWKIKQILPFTSCAAIIDIPESECEALVDLYHSTNGSGWTIHSGWLTTNTVCDGIWYGVKCENGHVTDLRLGSNNLSGVVDLSGLPRLKWINLNFNYNLQLDLSTLSGLARIEGIGVYSVRVYGDIAVFSGKRFLQEVLLMGGPSNDVYGNIESFSGCTALDRLWIINTNVEGTLDSFSRLTGLTSLVIGGNKLTGTIPADFATTMANITNDESVANDISNNLLDTEQSYDPDLVDFLDAMFVGWRYQKTLADMAITTDITWLTGDIGVYVGFPILYTNNGPQTISGAQMIVQTTDVDITGYDTAGYIGREYGIVGDPCYEEFISYTSSGVYYAGLDQIFSGMGLPDFYYFAQNLSYIYETNNPEMNYDGGRHETEGQWFMGLCSSMLQVDTLSECLSMFGLMTHQDISLTAIGGNVCGMGGTFGYFYNLSPLSVGESGSLIISGALLTGYTNGEIRVSTYIPTIIDDITGNDTLSLFISTGSEPLLPVYDLAVTKTLLTDGPYLPGAELQYRINYTNLGNRNLSNITIYDTTLGLSLVYADRIFTGAWYGTREYGVTGDICYDDWLNETGVYFDAMDIGVNTMYQQNSGNRQWGYTGATMNTYQLYLYNPRFTGYYNAPRNSQLNMLSEYIVSILPAYYPGQTFAEMFSGQLGIDITTIDPSCGTGGTYYEYTDIGDLAPGASGSILVTMHVDSGYQVGDTVVNFAYARSNEDNEQTGNNISLVYTTLETGTTDVRYPSPGPGGSRLTKDICAHIDCSSSYYDQTCGVCPSKPSTGAIHQAPSKIGDITNSPYSTELNSAYLRAYNFGITTMPTIQQANIEGNLIRSHMAKMMVEFAALFDRKINTGANCSFTDMRKQSDEMKYYSTLACQLGLMGLDDNGTPAEKFNPTDTVTRAQFGTVLSRLLYGNVNNAQKGTQRYAQHLEALKNAGIMKKIDDPSMKELRGYVMLMMMRAAK